MKNSNREPMVFFDMDDMLKGLKEVGGMKSIVSSDFDRQRQMIIDVFKQTDARIASVRKVKFDKG